METTRVSMANKIRLELATRLQQVQMRVHKALANVGMEDDWHVSEAFGRSYSFMFLVSIIPPVKHA